MIALGRLRRLRVLRFKGLANGIVTTLFDAPQFTQCLQRVIVTLLQLRKYLFGWSPIFLLVIFMRLINKLFKFGKDLSIVAFSQREAPKFEIVVFEMPAQEGIAKQFGKQPATTRNCENCQVKTGVKHN